MRYCSSMKIVTQENTSINGRLQFKTHYYAPYITEVKGLKMIIRDWNDMEYLFPFKYLFCPLMPYKYFCTNIYSLLFKYLCTNMNGII